ncbi:hypothetical protein TRFO_26207 [Tritrichomonas foetus]|uniref:Uncharacterized protein n=1 Tax=Tritrichomonas foetus TaxID=1144522 RepID=A0A1J4K4M6_9EUKA|nr:hypothetical protein TRFO_26207 [Tritrichomonas foetus]|eukprot:OHT05922.1 hypothetical protein TRFO_26207 [Tritrichomonas foetus]
MNHLRWIMIALIPSMILSCWIHLSAYSSYKKNLNLRYNSIMIIQDANEDSNYIKALIYAQRLKQNQIYLNNPSKKKIDYILIYDNRRFGNMVVALRHAISLCLHLKCSVIFHKDIWFLEKQPLMDLPFRFESFKKLDQYNLSQSNYLHGNFYYQQYYPYFKNTEDMVKIIQSIVNPSIPSVDIDKDALYIHIRSGDIFKRFVPNIKYGQPPLCFYTTILKKWNFSKIFLISEDLLNPVISKLIDEGATLLVTDLPKTLGYLSRAKNIAFGRGTFVREVLRLNNSEKTIFSYDFNQVYKAWVDFFSKEQFKMVTQYDMEPTKEYLKFLLSENWLNFNFQRKIMLESKCNDFVKVGAKVK